MTRVLVQFEWGPVQSVALDGGRPVFPLLPKHPGVYRITFEWPDRPHAVYIGETGQLRRRGRNYRAPGPTQRTSLRVHQELVSALGAAVPVTFATITTATLALDDGPPMPLDLTRKIGRLIVENAAIAAVLALRKSNPAAPIVVNRPGVGEAEWE